MTSAGENSTNVRFDKRRARAAVGGSYPAAWQSDAPHESMTAQKTSYLATVCVLLSTPLTNDEGEVVRGYYIVLGLWTAESDPRSMLRAVIRDGVIDWAETSWQRREPGEAPDSIKPYITSGGDDWYRSGRMYFV